MRSLAVCLLLAAAPVVAAPDRPILGGTPATVGEFPSVVVIGLSAGNQVFCTGTLIAKDWVLTAAHCVTPDLVGQPDQAALTASVQVFTHTLDLYGMPGPSVGADQTIPDPLFDPNAPGQGDSGLIHLATPITDVPPVMLNFVASRAQPGMMVTMVGYGATLPGSGGNIGIEETVQQTAVACSTLTPPPGITELKDANLLCYDQTAGKGKCHGDSGGPSFAMIDGKQVQVGVTSFGDPNCASVGADTRTDAEQAFITSHVKDLYCAGDADCASGRECFANGCIAQPFGPGGLGSTCGTAADCDSGMCAMEQGAMKCTMACTPNAANTCPSGFACETSGGTTTCVASDDGGGCCDASGAGGPTALVGIGLVGLVLRRRRRGRG